MEKLDFVINFENEEEASQATAAAAGTTNDAIEMEIQPNVTLYVNNLNEQIRVDDLKKELHKVFSEFGTIVEIKAKADIRMRGQAFVVFESLESAQEAKTQLSKTRFFGKELYIEFAKSKSDVIAKKEGTYKTRVPKNYVPAEFIEERLSKKKVKETLKYKETNTSNTTIKQTMPTPQAATQTAIIQPHHILFLENLPTTTTPDVIKSFFATFPGLKEVRLVAQRRVAFVEYEDESKASTALQALQQFKIGDNIVSVNFAKA